jgi:hypothetical protein
MLGNEMGRGEIEDQTAIHFLVAVEVEGVERDLRITKLSFFRRRSSKRSLRQFSSSETRQEIRSMGAMRSNRCL